MEREAAGVRYRDLGASAVRIEVFGHTGVHAAVLNQIWLGLFNQAVSSTI
jgi:hypothetical protein